VLGKAPVSAKAKLGKAKPSKGREAWKSGQGGGPWNCIFLPGDVPEGSR